MKLAARHLLIGMAEGQNEGAEEAAQRWATVDAKQTKNAGFIWLCLLLAGLSIFAAINDFREVGRYVKWGNLLLNFSWLSVGPMPSPSPTRDYTVQQKLLLFGDPANTSKAKNKEALWETDPKNPAYFAEYAATYVTEHDRLPPDFLETARRMAPENAWFTYLAAIVEAKDAVKSKRGGRSQMKQGKMVHQAPTWEILDQGRFERALALIREARPQREWTDYSAELLVERMALLPLRNYIDRMDMSGIMGNHLMSSNFRLVLVSDVIAAKAWTTSEAGDAAGFKAITADREYFLRAYFQSGSVTLLDLLVGSGCASKISISFAGAVQKLGNVEAGARWKKFRMTLSSEMRGGTPVNSL